MTYDFSATRHIINPAINQQPDIPEAVMACRALSHYGIVEKLGEAAFVKTGTG